MTAEVVKLDDRITTGRVLGEVVARIRDRARPLALLWLVGAVLSAGMSLALKATGAEAATERFGPEGVAYNVAVGVLDGVMTAIGLRIVLGPAGDWRRWDRSFIEGAALFSAITTIAGIAMLVADTTLQEEIALLASLLLLVGLAFISAKLVLWPAARVAGRTDITPAESWRRMRRATLGYMMAHAVVLVPLAVLSVVGPLSRETDVAEALRDAMFMGFTIFSLTASATVYDLRVQRGTRLGDIFS